MYQRIVRWTVMILLLATAYVAVADGGSRPACLPFQVCPLAQK